MSKRWNVLFWPTVQKKSVWLTVHKKTEHAEITNWTGTCSAGIRGCCFHGIGYCRANRVHTIKKCLIQALWRMIVKSPTVHEMHPSRKARYNSKITCADWLYCSCILCYIVIMHVFFQNPDMLKARKKILLFLWGLHASDQQLLWSRSDSVTFTDLSGNLWTWRPCVTTQVTQCCVCVGQSGCTLDAEPDNPWSCIFPSFACVFESVWLSPLLLFLSGQSPYC